MESQSYPERFEIAIKLFNKELSTIRVQQELKKKVEANTKETERKYVLREQMKVIQQQLGGDKDPKQAYIEKINKKVEEMKKDMMVLAEQLENAQNGGSESALRARIGELEKQLEEANSIIDELVKGVEEAL